MTETKAPSLRVIISYSPDDTLWKSTLEEQLRLLERFHNVHLWSIDRIKVGAEWRTELDNALSQADVGLLLISASYLASDFISDVELAKLFERHSSGGVRIIPVLLKSCPWELHPRIRQLLPEKSIPVAAFEGDGRDRALADVAREIASLVEAADKPKAEMKSEMSPAVSRPINPFLTEWDSLPWLRKVFPEPTRPLALAAISAVCGVVVAMLSGMVGANCMRAGLSAASNQRYTIDIVFGYWAELNHGPYQIFVVPIFVFLVFSFLNYTSHALRTLASGRRLMVTSPDGHTRTADPIAEIGSRNRAIFRRIVPLVISATFIFLFATEYGGISRMTFGWVQSESVYQLGQRVAMNPVLLSDFEENGKVGFIPSTYTLCDGASEKPSEGCRVQVSFLSGGTPPDHHFYFHVFLFLALVLQASFLSLAFWAVFKIAYVFAVLFESFTDDSLRSDSNSWLQRVLWSLQSRLRLNRLHLLRMRLDYLDLDHRFGLKEFDVVYVRAMLLLLAGGAGGALSFMNNFAKGTRAVRPDIGVEWALLGQLMVPSLVLMAIAMIPTIPAVVLLRMAIEGQYKKLDELNVQLAVLQAEGASEDRTNVIHKRIKLVRKQKAWPRRNQAFWPLLFFVFVMFGLSIGIPAMAAFRGSAAAWFVEVSQLVPRQILCPQRL